MKILLSALHHANFRSFESVVVELVARGHQVHLAADESETMGGQQLAERLSRTHPGVTWDFVPSLEQHEPWFDAARRLRAGLDYARVLAPQYEASPKLRLRTEARAPRVVRWAAGVPGVGPWATRAALTRLERLMPASPVMDDYLRRHAPDVLVLASLTYSRSQQLDQLKAARRLGIPVAAAVMSWDHLSSKALLHIAPDMILVWNDVQRREAIDMHGLPAERIVVTGAQCFDQWFARAPARSREAFCAAVGLRPDRRFVLWVNSVFNPPVDPPEPVLVLRWLAALRSHPALRDLGVLIRPHPERAGDWREVSLDGYDNVAVHGRNPIDAGAKDDYFDALSHSAAVVGLATSAFLEAAIVGRPVLALTPPEYRMHQEEMVHFRYLNTVGGGLLHTAPDLETHLAQLTAVLDAGAERQERNRRFLSAFVRPAGLDAPATPVFADAIERLARDGTKVDRSLDQHAWLRPLVGAAAARGQAGVGRWLLLDRRGDDLDDDREQKRLTVSARVEAKTGHRREKLRRAEEQRRREALAGRVKSVRSVLRKGRYLAAVAVYRVLAVAGIGQGGLGGADKR